MLGGRRPFTLATTVRLEQALGVALRKGPEAARYAHDGFSVVRQVSALLAEVDRLTAG